MQPAATGSGHTHCNHNGRADSVMNKRALFLGAAAAAALAPSVASAALLQDLFNGACLSGPGGASACAWNLEYNQGAVSPNFSNIDVSFGMESGVLGSVPTISYIFNDELEANDGDDILFAFNYTLIAPGGVSAVALQLTDVTFDTSGGIIEVSESYFSNNVQVGRLDAEIDTVFGTNINPVSTMLSGTYTTLFVEKDIRIQSEVDGFIGLGDLHQGYAPVPGTLALFAGGLAGAAAVRRRRARAAARG